MSLCCSRSQSCIPPRSMERTVNTAMLPLSAACIIFGFFIIDIKRQTLRKSVIFYCYMITVVLLLVPMYCIVRTLPLTKFNMSTVLYCVMHVVRVVSVTYYRIKCVTQQTAISDVLRNIDYADRLLERDAGVKVSHAKDQLLCTLYTVSASSMSVALLWYGFETGEGQQIALVLGGMYTNFSALEKYLAFYGAMLMSMHFTCLLYFINQRLCLLKDAIMKAVQHLDEHRKIAWDSRVVCVSLSGTLETADASVARLEADYETLKTVYGCIDAAYDGVQHTYREFAGSTLAITAVLASINIVFLIATLVPSGFTTFVVVLILFLQVTPVVFCECINLAFRSTQTLLNQFCSNITLKLGNKNAKKYTAYKRNQKQQFTFDCGYFDLDSNLLLLLYNFISLFVFSMLSST